MGNSPHSVRSPDSGSRKYGSIYIEMPSTTFTPGQSVEGVIHLHIRNYCYPAGRVVLQIIGEVKSRWTITGFVGEAGARVSMKRNGREVFLFQEEALQTFEKKELFPGDYTFPFKFELPDWLPSSFVYCGDQKSKLRIMYSVKACVEDACSLDVEKLPSLKGKRRMLVGQQTNGIIENHKIEVSDKIKWLGLMDEGESKVSVEFPTNSFKQGSMAQLNILLDNSNCGVDLKDFTLILMRKIQAISDRKNILEIEERVAERMFPGVAKKKKERRVLEILIMEESLGEKKLKNFSNRKKKVYEHEDTVLQSHLAPSVDIPKLRCHYFFKLQFNHSGVTLGSELPQIVFPIHVYPAQIDQELHGKALPENYQPKKFEQKEIVIGMQEKQELYRMCLSLNKVEEYDGLIRFPEDNFLFEDEY